MSDAPAQRKTQQQRVIFDVIKKAKGPLAIAEIHTRSEKNFEGLGIATVYRSIKKLHESKEIEAHIFPDGTTRYETAGSHHHHHFICEKCECSFCFDDCPHGIEDVNLPEGFKLNRHILTLYGICGDCQNVSA